MPVIEGRHNGRQILTQVFIAPPSDPRRMLFTSGIALIDTGATTSLICLRVAHELELPVRGKRQMLTARGSEMVNQYRFRLGFPSAQNPALPYLLEDDFNGSELLVQTTFDTIVGMDILSRCDFQSRSNGVWTLSF